MWRNVAVLQAAGCGIRSCRKPWWLTHRPTPDRVVVTNVAMDTGFGGAWTRSRARPVAHDEDRQKPRRVARPWGEMLAECGSHPGSAMWHLILPTAMVADATADTPCRGTLRMWHSDPGSPLTTRPRSCRPPPPQGSRSAAPRVRWGMPIAGMGASNPACGSGAQPAVRVGAPGAERLVVRSPWAPGEWELERVLSHEPGWTLPRAR